MMSSNVSLVIEAENLSHAWAKLFLHTSKSGTKVSTVLLSLTNFKKNEVVEDSLIKESLDNCLSIDNQQSIHTVANTIFPVNLWKRVGLDRQELYKKYLQNFPRIKSLGCHRNDQGTYFQRLISFGGDIRKGKRLDQCNGNQLEHIITSYLNSERKRLTMFQAAIFDPNRDHNLSPRQGFPCLQHLQFIPDQKEGTLTVNAYYATQKIFEKAYGNYLGICRLSNFMAHEMQLSLGQVNFFIGIAKLEIPKTKVKHLKETLQQALNLLNTIQNDGV